jgi:hypothetical protein
VPLVKLIEDHHSRTFQRRFRGAAGVSTPSVRAQPCARSRHFFKAHLISDRFANALAAAPAAAAIVPRGARRQSSRLEHGHFANPVSSSSAGGTRVVFPAPAGVLREPCYWRGQEVFANFGDQGIDGKPQRLIVARRLHGPYNAFNAYAPDIVASVVRRLRTRGSGTSPCASKRA